MATPTTEVWQARIDSGLARALRADAEVLGLSARTDIVKAGLELLHRRAAEERMAQDIAAFHDGATAPLPVGVRPSRHRPATEVAPEVLQDMLDQRVGMRSSSTGAGELKTATPPTATPTAKVTSSCIQDSPYEETSGTSSSASENTQSSS